MKLVIPDREAIRAVSGAVLEAFDALKVRISAGWAVQHGADGEHTNVTAQTLATGRLAFSDIASATINVEQTNNFEPDGLTTAAILRLNSTSAAPVYLTGLKFPLDESGRPLDGRVLVVENVSAGTTFVLECESTYSVPRNRFRTPAVADPLNAAAPARAFLLPATLTILIYNSSLARWVVNSRSVDDNVRQINLAGGTTHHNLSVANLLSLKTLRIATDARSGLISGLVGAGVPETTRKTVMNAGTYAFDLLHLNTNSSADNRIVCPGGVRYRVNPRETFDLQRTADEWRVVEKADQFCDVVYASGNFTASSGTWTVEQADQTTLAYQLDGSRMIVSFDLRTTSVSGGQAALQIAIPVGRVAARTMANRLAYALNAGTAEPSAYAAVAAGESVIKIFRDAASTAWSAATNTTTVRGQLEFMVGEVCADIVEPHGDVAAVSQAHQDADGIYVPHSDIEAQSSHGDSPHLDSPFVAHGDQTVIHLDQEHEDHQDSIFHEDVDHADRASSHQDSAQQNHVDSQHADVHQDQIHGDTPGVSSGHLDVPAISIDHDDVGLSCATTHADV